MSTIDDRKGWTILHRYAEDCLEIASGALMVLYVTGSLPGGYYRVGQSDVDAAGLHSKVTLAVGIA